MKCKQQAGFTLVELVVGISLMVLIMGSVTGVLTSFIRHGVQGVDMIDRQQEARWAVNMMAQDIKYATKFNTDTDTSSSVDVDRNDFSGVAVRVHYYTIKSGDNYVLHRQATYADKTVEIRPIGNENRGFVADDGFTITKFLVNGKVNSVQIVYKIRRSSTDASEVIAQTMVYPINKDKML